MNNAIRLGDFFQIRRVLLDPRTHPSESFFYYSIPAFDEHGQPEVVRGSEIDSVKFIVETGTLLISKLNPRIRRVWQVSNSRDFRTICSTEFVNAVPRSPSAVEFLFYLLSSDEVYSHLERLAEGTTNSHVRFKPASVENIRLHQTPDEVCWARIAEVLRALDAEIQQTKALIAKYQQIKAGLMHNLFTRGVTPDGRLRPPHSEAPLLYQESPLGWIPKEWQVQRLGTILKQCGGYLQTGPFGRQLHAHEYQHEGVPVVMPQDINDGVIETAQISRISEKRAQELSRHRMKADDVVIARRGDLSRASAISQREEFWLCGTGCMLLRLQGSTLRATFAALAYRHDFVQRQIAGRAVGTTMSSLNNNVMERLLFPCCDSDEQARIGERVASVDSAVQFTCSYLRILNSIKQGLMQDLLTGRVHVNIEESAIT